MRKKGNGKGKTIGLARDYFDGIIRAPFVDLKFNGKSHEPNGQTKNFSEILPFIDRSSYVGITPSAREYIIDEYNLSRRILKKIKGLETISR